MIEAELNLSHLDNALENVNLSFTVCISSYIAKPLTIDESATCEELVHLFKINPDIECIVLVDSFNRPLSLFMKNKVFMRLSRRYSTDLYYEKPVTILIDESPLLLGHETSPEYVIQAAMNRNQKQRYDCVVIVSEKGTLLGVLTLSNILEMSNQLQQNVKYEQALLIEKVNGYVHHIANQMKEVELEIVRQHQHFSSMIDYTLQGKNLLQLLVDSFDKIIINTDIQNHQIINMKQDSKQLKSISDDVVELSEQSNILALNATIEAAKAKESGLAFNVVAKEVRELSQKTKGSVTHIQNVIQTMMRLIELNEATSSSSVQITQDSRTVIYKAEEVFKSIFASLAQHQTELATISQQAKHVTALTNKTKEELVALGDYLK